MSNNSENQRPKWLRRLEKESWQAELVVSGLALYGTFQLPAFVYWLTNYFIKNFPIEQYFIGYMIVYMNLLGISILMTFFIIHLILRAYWIGLIGLNSVYPNGYGKDGGLYSPLYTNRFIKLLPSIDTSIKKVDDICSTLFSGAFSFLMIYGMMSITTLVLLILYNSFSDYIPASVAIGFLKVLGVLFVTFMILSMISNTKWLKNNHTIQNIYYWFSVSFGYLLSSIFFKPVNQIMMTFYSNYKKEASNLLLPIAFFVIGTALSLYHVTKSNIPILIRQAPIGQAVFQKNRVYPVYYESQHLKGKEILNPIIPSDQIKSPFLKVFIPIFDNEEYFQKDFCEPYENDPLKTRRENNRVRNEQRIFCYRKYHRLSVNDSLYQVEFLKHNHRNNDEFGIVAYLPTSSFKVGKNELQVLKMKNLQDSIYSEVKIPFWFSKN